MRRGLLAFALLVVGGVAVGAAYERQLARRRDRLDVYFGDGSFVTYVEGSSEAAKLLPLARRVLAGVQESPSEWPDA